MSLRDGDEEIGDDGGCGDVGSDDGDLLRCDGAHRANVRTGDAGAFASGSGKGMRVDHRLGHNNRGQNEEDGDPEQAHRVQANTQFDGCQSNSADSRVERPRDGANR